MNTGYINCFEITHCGLYEFSLESDRIASNSVEVFDFIIEWLQNRNFGDTIPWDPQKSGKLGKCYCKNFYKDPKTGDIFLTLWKQGDSSKNGKLYGVTEISGEDQSINLKQRKGAEKIIWGRPCYYWISPRNEKIFSFKFDDSLCDKELFTHWISSVITNKVKNFPYKSVIKDEKSPPKIAFIKDSKRLFFRFSSRIFIGKTQLENIKERAAEVRQVVYRERISLSEGKDDRAWYLKLADKKLPYMNSHKESKKRTIEIYVDATPTLDQMENLVDGHLNDLSQLDDSEQTTIGLGVKMEGGAIIWADEFRITESVTTSKVGILLGTELAQIASTKSEKLFKAINSGKLLQAAA